MLVVQRKRNEEIVARLPDGREITIVLVQIRGERARIGVEAPGDVEVDRREVRIGKDAEQLRSEAA